MKETGPESAIEAQVSGLAKQSSSSDFSTLKSSELRSARITHHVLCITVIVKVTQKHVRVRSAQHTEF
jgi:hypothetical protein